MRSKLGIVAALAWLGLPACETFTGLDVTYVDCFPPPVPYLEQFDVDEQELEKRCWKRTNVDEGREVATDDGNLFVGFQPNPLEPVSWQGDPPTLARRVRGDFALVTQVEASEKGGSGHCLGAGDSAGIVLSGESNDGSPIRAALLLKPDPEQVSSEMCGDDVPIGVVIEAHARGSGDTEPTSPVGDGETELAVCRLGSDLRYFYRDALPDDMWIAQDWKPLAVAHGSTAERIDQVGTGPLDIGLAATTGGEKDIPVQGEFNWVDLLADGHIGPSCRDLISDLEPPDND